MTRPLWVVEGTSGWVSPLHSALLHFDSTKSSRLFSHRKIRTKLPAPLQIPWWKTSHKRFVHKSVLHFISLLLNVSS